MRKILLTACILFIAGCGNSPSPERPIYIEQPAPAPAPQPLPTPDECKQGVTISFVQVLPILNESCVSCHPGYNQIGSVRRNLDDIINRINLPFNDPKRMPRAPAPTLSTDEIRVIESFKEDGAKESDVCKDGITSTGFKFQSFKQIELDILGDQNKLNARQQDQARYLVNTHKANEGMNAEQVERYAKALNKALNSISGAEVIIPPTSINSDQTIFRFFLEDYKLVHADWNLILKQDQFKFISNTSLGQQIRILAGNDQPWLHGDNFIFSALSDPATYNKLIRLPRTLAELLIQIDVDLKQQAEDFTLRFMGFNSSPISIQKNRLVIRGENSDGNRYFYMTFDTNSLFLADKNLFAFPLLNFNSFLPTYPKFLFTVPPSAIFNFDAGEFIYSLPNGLQGYGLSNNQGLIELAAPLDIVTSGSDNPFSPEIKNGLDCFRCHSKGLIPTDDQIRDHVNINASEFTRNDVDLVNAYYKSNVANRAIFQNDIGIYSVAANKVGNGLDKDTMNEYSDDLRKDLAINQIASFVFMTESEFKFELNRSSLLKGQIGQLLTGSTITFTQFQQTFPDMIRELRLGEDELDE